MSLFCKDNLSVYHIHIPRTGGRFITQTFIHNDYKLFHCEDTLSLYGIECFHLHYPIYEQLEGVSESIQFAVIRNPLDRFKSEFSNVIVKRKYDEKKLEEFESYDRFLNWIEYERMTSHYAKNWFRPQHEFIGPNTLIWKFEDGLTKNFREWFYKITENRLEDKEYSYWGDEESELSPERKKYKMSKKLIENVKKYYQQDFQLLNY